MNSIKSCPTCGYACSAVRNTNGDVLGYFCNLGVDGACDYIDVESIANKIEGDGKTHSFRYWINSDWNTFWFEKIDV